MSKMCFFGWARMKSKSLKRINSQTVHTSMSTTSTFMESDYFHVEYTMNAVVATADGSVASKKGLTVLQRLADVSEERKLWISKRDELLMRKEKLFQLLQLQAPNLAKDANIDTQRAKNEGVVANKEEDQVEKTEAAALARKKELSELQARAEAAKEKQQIAASVLARNVKQLPAKRKRENTKSVDKPRKKAHVRTQKTVGEAPAVLEMHPFAAAPDLDVGTTKLAEAACFRIATRHFMQANRLISREKLVKVFKGYTGKTLEKLVDVSSLKCIVESCNGQEPRAPSTSSRSACWQPGRQFMKTPTFNSSDASRIQSMIQVEKEVVAAVCDTLRPSHMREPESIELVKRCRRTSFLENCLVGGATTPTLSDFLCARVGINPVKPGVGNPFRTLNRSYGQMAGVFENMEKWLCEHNELIGPHSGSLLRLRGPDRPSEVRDRLFPPKFARPFAIATESIIRQLRGATETANPATSKRIDPMKMLCHFELNGACNDQNCSNYHRKDYESVEIKAHDVSLCTADDNDLKVPRLDETDELLLSFATFRERIMKKWPVITTQTSSAATEESASWVVTDAVIAGKVDTVVPVAKDKVRCEGNFGKDDSDFISFDAHERPPEISSARYFDSLDSREAKGDMLQTKVKECPNDTNAWLLLAIYQLRIDVGMSDEAVSFSDKDRLQRELVFLSKELNTKLHSDASRIRNIEEANLKRCLHTLSRALEVESNAYCEALWLLYLHLCKQVTNKQTGIDMVEQAVQFLPSSHALWLRYISTYDFDSMGMAEGIYWRLLEHLARKNSVEGGLRASKSASAKKLSILLTAICFHLCMKLWGAGTASRVIELLSALLQFGDASLEFGWCSLVHGKLRKEELIVFYLAFAHVLLCKELPGIIEHWLAASCDASIPFKNMTYSVESFRRSWLDIDVDVCGRVLTAYESAFHIFAKECKDDQDVGNAILNNWMLVLAYQDDVSKKNKTLHVFLEEKLDFIQLCPGASLTAAKLMGLTPPGEKQACQLMLTMMSRSSLTTFPEALHHYMIACRQFPSLMDTLDKILPDVLERLASLLDVDIDRVKKSLQDIMHDTSNISKSRALKALLDTLLVAWIDQLALLRRSDCGQPMNERTEMLADVCVALDICHLMGRLLEPSVAIDGIQMVLSSPSFGALSCEARQLAWMQRFVFQVDALQQEESSGLPCREHQTILTRLFRKYIAEMSVMAEMTRQVLKHIRYDIAQDAVNSAVCACLYPERSHLITFEVNLELFQLCSNAVAQPEKTAFFAAFADSLALSPEFSLAFSDVAFHEWELLAARANLRKCLIGSKTKHARILQALVAVEMRLRNMKAVSCLLKSEIEADPLLLEPWRLIVGLEVLFGEMLDVRSKSISEEMEKRQLVFACNTFGDDKISDQKDISWSGDLEIASLNLRGHGLKCVPNAVLLQNKLVSLDISGNECTELPIGLRQLQNLRKLNVSENALIEFPAGVHGLTQLNELRLAHNNMTTCSVLPHLDVLDISWNAISNLPAPALFSRTPLSTLRAEGNAIPVDELSRITDLLSKRKYVTSRSLASEASSDEHGEEKGEDSLRTQKPNSSLSESTAIQKSEGSKTVVVEASIPANAEMTTANINKGNISRAKKDDGDRNMERKSVDAASKSKGAEHVFHPREDEEHQVIEDAGTLSMSKDNNGNCIIEESTGDSATNEPTMASKIVEQAREVIEVDSSESSENNDEDTIAPGSQAVTTNFTTASAAETANTVIDLSISTVDEPAMASVAEDGKAVTAAITRRQSGHEGAFVAQRKLAEYMEHYHIDSRAEVRERNLTLWREFLAANLPVNVELPACRMCFAPNDGHNQRFNSTVLCMHCLEEALVVLKERKGQVMEMQEDV